MSTVNRRDFLKSAGVAAAAAPLLAHAQEAPPPEATILDGDKPVDVHLALNGASTTLKVLPATPLIHAIRNQTGLTGCKVSCGAGGCGACTLHVDGKAQLGCLTMALDVEGRSVTTVEGVSNKGALHPVQQAIVEADGLQCGYCTPGMVMSGVAFYDQWRASHGITRPPAATVAQALSGNLCRCGAQPSLIAAIQAACEGKAARHPAMPGGGDGVTSPRADAQEKVTGTAKYTVDVQLPGMLHAVMLRSPHAHANVKKVDLGPALRMPGVKAAVVTLPQGPKGYATLRFAGQDVAAVAALTREQARDAAAAIVVDYDAHQAVVDFEDAAKPGAPLVYALGPKDAVVKSAEGPSLPEALQHWNGNVRGPAKWPIQRGTGEDVLAQVAGSALHVDMDVATAVQMHMTLEPQACVAVFTPEGLTLHAGTQTTQAVQEDLASIFDLPSSKVRVHSAYVGGAFGCKAGVKPEFTAAARLSREAGAPVSMVISMTEQLVSGGNRPGTRQRIRVGGAANGKVEAIHHEGQSFCGIGVGEKSTGLTDVHYPAAIFTKDVNVLTHSAPSTPFRAPGFPANAFALEQAVDALAVQGNLDPLLMRLHHDPEPRRAAVYKLAREAWGLGQDLKQVAPEKGRFVRGVGVATAEWFVLTAPNCTVEVRASRDGHVELSTATHDLGNGSRSVLTHLAHRELGLPFSNIQARVGDSALPTAPGTFGSITTNSIAPAALHALEELKTALQGAGIRRLGGEANPAGIKTPDGKVVPFAQLFQHLPDNPYVTLGRRGPDKDGFRLPPGPLGSIPALPFALTQDITASAQVAEVEVDRLLGRIHVRRLMVALDAGRLMSPVTAASQVMGAAIQGISRALYEGRRMDTDTGRQLSRNLDSYAILGMADAPDISVHFLDSVARHSPHGGLGLGENSTVATCAAVANAFFRATGRRILSTPMTPDKVLAALA